MAAVFQPILGIQDVAHNVQVLGWGAQDDSSYGHLEPSSRLKGINLKGGGGEVCRTNYAPLVMRSWTKTKETQYFTPRFICTAGDEGGPCDGDEGGNF